MKINQRTRGVLSALALGALLLLGSCNFGLESPEEPSPSPASTLPELAASANPYTGPAAGEYFNGGEGISLRIDGAGGFVLSSAGGRLEGSYTATESEIILSCGSEELRVFHSGDGLVLSGVAGLFSPVERKTGFAELGVAAVCDREYGETDEGEQSLRDYTLELGLSYPAEMSAPENLIADAVVVWDGDRGYVTGRNVTEEFFGEAEDFMGEYMRRRVPEDFRLLYGAEAAAGEVEMLDEGVSGRLASAQTVLEGGGERIYVKAIMYTSTYADGTVNYILKCFFAPEGDERSFNALANSVMNMTAVRRR